MRCGNRARIQQHGDAGFFHLFSGEFAELGCYFRQDLVLGMNQADNHIFLVKISVKAGAAADKFIDFAGDFHAAEAGTDDDEAEMPSSDSISEDERSILCTRSVRHSTPGSI